MDMLVLRRVVVAYLYGSYSNLWHFGVFVCLWLRISFHSRMLQAFPWILFWRQVLEATKILMLGRWLNQIEHTVRFSCWSYVDSDKSFVHIMLIHVWFSIFEFHPAGSWMSWCFCCAKRPLLRPLPFIPLHLAAASLWSTSIGGRIRSVLRGETEIPLGFFKPWW